MSKINQKKYKVINSNEDIQKNKKIIIEKIDQLLK